MNQKSSNNQGRSARKSIRHLPNENEAIALIDIDQNHDRQSFIHQYTALIFSESRGGMGLVLRKNNFFQIGDTLLVKIGQIYPIRSEIVWRKDEDPHLLKIGIKFLE
ncbi:MAG: hypothetical protein HQK50_18650 [Oligoflexia bacterium]|nr:hypothetical protein [Oligoflexia bacterium]MBF0367602.1 hypothetical protein [Oligoflexia bacterium]